MSIGVSRCCHSSSMVARSCIGCVIRWSRTIGHVCLRCRRKVLYVDDRSEPQFRERSVRKYYEALVWGHVPDTKGLIELPIRPDLNNRPRQIIDRAKGKAAQTRYRVINIGRQSSRLRLQPITGRSHQLRIHLASIGYPILGCDLYAHRAAFEAADRLMLHATSLRISHPTTLESLDFRCPAEFSVIG